MTHTLEMTKAFIAEQEAEVKEEVKEESAAKAAFDRIQPVMDLLHDCIKDFGATGIPSGHLYAMLVDKMSLDTYQMLIGLMVRAGGITLTNHVLRAVDAK